MNVWLTMIIAGLLTYGIRLSFIVLFGDGEISEPVRRGLRFVPPAVLTAIIFPELLFPNGSQEISLLNTRLIAGILAILVAWRTKSVMLTILVGMGVLWVLEWLL
jgi:branched-subunit amino acid transport protein